jgi:hypothetical protein
MQNNPDLGRGVRRLARRALAGAVIIAAALACSAAGFANAADQQQPPTVIRSLTVSGTPASPVFTVRGGHLGLPVRNPRRVPSGQPLCPLKVSGNAGFDYGSRFYLIAWDGQPAGHNNQLYAAGRYRPQLNELDCIGLIVHSHSPTQIAFTFGHAYTQYRSQYRQLEDGDVVEVVLNGGSFASVVHFHHQPS